VWRLRPLGSRGAQHAAPLQGLEAKTRGKGSGNGDRLPLGGGEQKAAATTAKVKPPASEAAATTAKAAGERKGGMHT